MSENRRLKVLYATAEISPYSKVGGLADVAASLPKALAALGHDVRVITPEHAQVERALSLPKMQAGVQFLGRDEQIEVLNDQLAPGVPLYFVGNPTFFRRPQVYGAPDDLLRYQLFSAGVLAAMKLLDWQPDVLHCNDWHTAFLPFALRNRAWGDPFYRPAASVLSIHNLRYRGPDEFTDILGQGIYYASALNTVSRTYAEEITTPEYGEGLDSLLRLRQDRLHGIINGIDPEVFDPSRDPVLPAPYDAGNLQGKAVNGEALRRRAGLPDAEAPLAGMVSRLTEQKGVDLVAGVLERAVRELGMQFVILGTGDPGYEQRLRALAEAHPDHISVIIGFDPDLAQLIYGGADMFLMPSRYEPCGLGQLIAMRYGTVPVVRKTGGLADTVEDFSTGGRGTGFVFEPYDVDSLYNAVERAAVAFYQPDAWRALQVRGMSQDFSWDASARQYEALYYEAIAHK